MNILQQFLETVQYRLTDAWEHQWESYHEAQVLGCVNDYAAFNVVFLREDQTVIEITVSSELGADTVAAYRWINPDYRDAIFAEAAKRGVDRNYAHDGCSYIDLDVVEDVLTKGKAMLANEEFDTRVQVPLDLGDDILFELFKMAHEQDITFNEFMTNVLKKAIDEKSDN